MARWLAVAGSLVMLACGGPVEDDAVGEDTAAARARFPKKAPGDRKYVFVSSQLYTGNLGGVSGANAKCQQLATAAGLPGTYRAWLSDSLGNTPAVTFTRSTVPYVLPDGRVVANDWADLTDGTLRIPINRTETGGAAPRGTAGCSNPAAQPFSGTLPDGTTYPGLSSTFHYCADWTSGDPTDGSLGGQWGLTSATDEDWTEYCSGGGCGSTANLYCFQQ